MVKVTVGVTSLRHGGVTVACQTTTNCKDVGSTPSQCTAPCISTHQAVQVGTGWKDNRRFGVILALELRSSKRTAA